MKKIILLLLLSVNVFAQKGIALTEGETMSLNSGYYNIGFNGSGHLIISGEVSVSNLNNYQRGAKLTVLKGATLHLQSSLNANGGTITNIEGTLNTNNFEIQNGGNVVNITGHVKVHGDYQLSDNSVINMSGLVEVTNYTNMNGSGYVNMLNCANWHTVGLNNNKENSFTGKGNLTYQTGNINRKITNSNSVFINSDKQCVIDPLPVEIVKTDFYETQDGVKYLLQVTPESNLQFFDIETSLDGKTWEKVKRIESVNNQKYYEGTLK